MGIFKWSRDASPPNRTQSKVLGLGVELGPELRLGLGLAVGH